MTKKTTVILPAYNEELGLADLLKEIERCLTDPLELLIVDDGSNDRTSHEAKAFKQRNGNSKRVIRLSRNFGHQHALFAGLEHASCDSQRIVVMDADFQDHPSDIPLLLASLEHGFDCVYAIRPPQTSNRLVDLLTGLFYRIQTVLSSFPIPRHAGTFCAFNDTFLKQLLTFKEVDLYFPGLRAYTGMAQSGVTVKRGARRHGKSRVGLLGLLRLSITGLFGFSALPMRAILIGGALVTAICLLLGLLLTIMYFLDQSGSFGVTPLVVLVLTLFGIQMMFLGVVGEYVGKLFIETKRRPRVIVAEITDG